MGEGMIMVEVEDGKGFICHEECWEMYSEFDDTGDDVAKQIDDGYIEHMHSIMEEDDEDKFTSSY